MRRQQNVIPQQLNVCLNTHPGRNMHRDVGCKDNKIIVFALLTFWLRFKYHIGFELQNINYTKLDTIMYIVQLFILLISETFFLMDIDGYQVAIQKNC